MSGDGRRAGLRGLLTWQRLGLALLLLYGLLLAFLRPVTPFEWDEVLFLRSLEHIDVLEHSPHPPGFPGYVFWARLVHLAIPDPLLAVQVATLLLVLAGLWATYRVVIALGGEPPAALAAAAMTACVPELAFMATVGTSDASGAAAAVLAVLALVASTSRPTMLVPASLVTGAVLSLRPQVLPVIAPALLWATVAAWRRGRLRALAAPAGVGLVTLVAFWLPIVLLTGAQRYLSALQTYRQYLATVAAKTRFPQAPLGKVCQSWLLDASGVRWLSIALWVLVVAGTVIWVRRGRKSLALVAGSAALLYLVFAIFAMESTVSVRYFLPCVPFLAILASGVTALPGRTARAAGLTLAAAWCVAAAAWAAPAFPLRRQPAPVWQALTWIRDSFDRQSVRVAFDSLVGPHARYVLEPAGFAITRIPPGEPVAAPGPSDRQLLFVSSRRPASGTLLFHAAWDSPRLLRLAWNRYGWCSVWRVVEPTDPFSPAWERSGPRWRLARVGRIELAGDRPPLRVVLANPDAPLELRVAGVDQGTLPAGGHRVLLLGPGKAAAIEVKPAGNGPVTLDAVTLEPLGDEPAGQPAPATP